MGEGVVASPFLEKEYVSEFRLFLENPALGPSKITFGKEPNIPPKSNLSQDKWMLGHCPVAFHQGEKERPRWGLRAEVRQWQDTREPEEK